MRFLDMVPRARATLMENMREGFLVLDAMDRIVDMNAAARRLIGTDSAMLGGSLAEAFPLLSDGMSRTRKGKPLSWRRLTTRTLPWRLPSRS